MDKMIAMKALAEVRKRFASLGTAAFCKVVNNLTEASEGGVLDARQGKALNEALTNLSNLMGATSISGIGDGTVTGAISTLNSKTKRAVFAQNGLKFAAIQQYDDAGVRYVQIIVIDSDNKQKAITVGKYTIEN